MCLSAMTCIGFIFGGAPLGISPTKTYPFLRTMLEPVNYVHWSGYSALRVALQSSTNPHCGANASELGDRFRMLEDYNLVPASIASLVTRGASSCSGDEVPGLFGFAEEDELLSLTQAMVWLMAVTLAVGLLLAWSLGAWSPRRILGKCGPRSAWRSRRVQQEH